MSLEGMSEDVIRNKEQKLLGLVDKEGGTAGNIKLLKKLHWPDEQYWSIRDRLVDAGELTLGRGRGGSVRLPETDLDEVVEPEVVFQQEQQREEDLYSPLNRLIREQWVKDQRFERSLVEITARQGRRDTGGTWTRPDIVVVSLTTLLYVPGKHFEVVTFEVKPWAGLDVTGVYEALAHYRASTRSYLLTQIDEDLLGDEITERHLQRIDEEAKRHGVGFIVVTNMKDYGTWEERIEAVYREPPHLLNDFVSLQLSDGAKNDLLTWFR